MATRGIVFTVEARDLKDFGENASKSFKKAQQGAREFGGVLGSLGSEFGSFGKIAGSALAGLAVGGPMGLAMAGVQMLTGYFGDLKKAEEEAAKAAKKMSDDIVADTKKAADEVAALMLKLAGGTDAMEFMRGTLTPEREKLAQMKAAAQEAQNILKLFQSGKTSENGVMNPDVVASGARSLDDARIAAQAAEDLAKKQAAKVVELEKKTRGLLALEEKKGMDETAQKKEQARKDEEAKTRTATGKAEAANRQHQDFMLSQDIAAQDDLQRIYKETDKALWDINERAAGLTKQQLEDEVAAVYAAEQRKLNAYLDTQTKKATEEGARQYYNKVKPEDRMKFMGPREGDSTNQLKSVAQRQAEVNAAFAETKAIAEGVGSSFANMVGSIVMNSGNAEQAIKGFGASLLQMALNYAAMQMVAHIIGKPAKIAEATADAGIVGAGTAAALATNPLTALAAIPAGIAAQTAALAAFVPVAAAAKGWDLPAGGPFPSVLHSREMVLPEAQADVIRGLAGGKSRGGGNTFVINAVDAKSVERALTNGDALLNVFRDFQRSGRL